MQIIINIIEIETVQTTSKDSPYKTFAEGNITVHFTFYNEGVELIGKVESRDIDMSSALYGLKNAIRSKVIDITNERR